jgi:hypothetical protein
MIIDFLRSDCKTLGWNKMIDLKKIRHIPFGVYAFTKPLDDKPNDSTFCHELSDVVYIGMAGKTYSDTGFFYDKKRSGKKEYWMCSVLYKRLNSHRKNLIRTNLDKDRETSYNTFYENYGFGKELMEKIYFSVLVPKTTIKEVAIRSWLAMIENTAIYEYTCNFDRPPIMQIAHKNDYASSFIIETSYSNQRRKNIEDTSLTRFMNG